MLFRTAVAKSRRAQPAPISNGIWVTDLMLEQAVKRFSRKCTVPSGRSLHVKAGPLESRRRKSKRHMTGALHSPSDIPPFWHLVPPLDGDTWEWKPPSTPRSSDETEAAKEGKPSLLGRLIEWLRTPTTTSVPDAAADPTTAQPIDGLELAKKHREDFQLTLASMPSSIGTESLDELCEEYCRNIEYRLQHGQFPTGAVKIAFHPVKLELWRESPQRVVLTRVRDYVRRGLLLAIVKHASLKNTDETGQAFHWTELMGRRAGYWYELLECFGILQSSWSKNDAILLCWLIQRTPCEILSTMPRRQVVWCMARAIMTLSRSDSPQDDLAGAIQLSKALEALDKQQRDSVREYIDSVIYKNSYKFQEEERDRLEEVEKRVRWNRLPYYWLLVLAANPTNAITHLRARVRVRAFEFQRLTSEELLVLVLARLVAHDIVSAKSAKQRLADAQPWTGLARQLLRSESAGREIGNLFLAAGWLGRPSYLSGLSMPDTESGLPSGTLQALAEDTNDHRFACYLWDSVSNVQKNDAEGRRLPEWSWRTWSQFVERLIKDEKEAHSLHRVWGMLDRRYGRAERDFHGEEAQHKAEFLDEVARWFTEARHLPQRVALRHVARCAALQRPVMGAASERVAAHLTEIVIRGMGEIRDHSSILFFGQSGRLEWLLQVVYEAQGEVEALRVQQLLEGWREVMRQRRPDLDPRPLERPWG